MAGPARPEWLVVLVGVVWIVVAGTGGHALNTPFQAACGTRKRAAGVRVTRQQSGRWRLGALCEKISCGGVGRELWPALRRDSLLRRRARTVAGTIMMMTPWATATTFKTHPRERREGAAGSGRVAC